MSDNQIELGIIQKIKNFLDITETIDDVQLYESLSVYRNQMHPDNFYDEPSKKEANEKFITATHLLTDLNSYINREKISKSTTDLVKYEKDYQIVNTQQKVVDCEREIDRLNKKITKCKEIIGKLLEQNKLLSKNSKEANLEELRKAYKNNSKIQIGIGVKLFFVIVYASILNIDKVSIAFTKYIPFSAKVFSCIVFIVISISILINVRKLIQNTLIEHRARKIETTSLLAKFSQLIEKDHFGSKISEIKIYDFIRTEFTFKKKHLRIIDLILGTNNEIVLEKYKNVFINSLLEKQLIKIAKAKGLDREFYVFGTSWNERMNESKEMNTEIIDDQDIETLVESFDE